MLKLGARGSNPRGVLRISNDKDDQMEAKSRGLPTKPKKSLDQKLTPKNPMLFFPALKFSREH